MSLTKENTTTERPLLSRLGIFAFGLLAYSACLASLTYAIGFVANVVVPKGIDDGTVGALIPSLLINAGLLMIFVVQHSIMARPWFKKHWTKIVPTSMERATFVLAASVSLGLVYFFWQPQPAVLWEVTHPVWSTVLFALSMVGWAIVFGSSYLISHFDLFGMRQVWLELVKKPYMDIGFRVVGIYKFVRHPLMTGFLVAVWATPTMTVGHLFFAVMITAYIWFGVTLEERDLIAHLGEKYRQYRRSVPGIIPFIRLPRPTRSANAPVVTQQAS